METGSSGSILEDEPRFLEEFFRNVRFPATKNELMEQAKSYRKGMSPRIEEGDAVLSAIMRRLGFLPDDESKKYKSADDVLKEYDERVSKASEKK